MDVRISVNSTRRADVDDHPRLLVFYSEVGGSSTNELKWCRVVDG